MANGREQELIANSEWLIARTKKVLSFLYLLSAISHTPYALFFGRATGEELAFFSILQTGNAPSSKWRETKQ